MNFEKAIAGKTYSEILSMEYRKRSCWYKIISAEEKEEAMKIVNTRRLVRLREAWTPKRKDEFSKNNLAKRKVVRDKIRESHLGKLRSEETKAKISASRIGKYAGINHPLYGKTGDEHPLYKRPRSGEAKSKISASWTVERRKKQSVAMMGMKNPMKRPEVRVKVSGENNPNFNNWISKIPYCYKWNESLREEVRNRWGRVCVLTDMLRTVMGKKIGLDNLEGHEIFNKQRYSVHHIRGDKMEGCNGKEMALIPLQGKFNTTKFDGLRLEEHPFYITLFLLKDIERKHRGEIFEDT